MFSSYYTLMDQLQGHLKVKGQNREEKKPNYFFWKRGMQRLWQCINVSNIHDWFCFIGEEWCFTLWTK